MKPLESVADDIMLSYSHKLDDRLDNSPIYSFDGPNIHRCALAEMVPHVHERENTFPLPAYSPDMHKVFQHVHAILTNQLQDLIASKRGQGSVKYWRGQLKKLFWGLKPKSVQKDIESLPATFLHISTPTNRGGSGGDYAPRGLN